MVIIKCLGGGLGIDTQETKDYKWGWYDDCKKVVFIKKGERNAMPLVQKRIS